MVNEPSPKCVGLEFVRQYYTVLNKAPSCLHRFYSNDSKFLHNGGVVMGQTEIHKKILSLGYNDCHAKIQLVDAFDTLGDGVLIQVTGELSNNGLPLRKFTQSIVLAPQSPKKYYVHSDIFHYIDEIFDEPPIDEVTNEGDNEREVDRGTPTPDESFVGQTVNGTMHEPEVSVHSVSSMPTIQAVASEQRFATPTGMSKNPPPVSPIPHMNPQHISEAMVSNNTRNQNSVNEDLSNDAVVCQDEWNISTPVEEVADKPEEKMEPAQQIETSKPVPQPVVSNEPKTYANRLKNSSYGSGPMPAVTANHHPEPSPITVVNHINKPKPEARSFSKPSTWTESSTTFQKSSTKHFQEDDRRRFLMPDSHQVFVGNLPHTISEEELKETFEEFGKVVDVRINTAKGKTSTKGANHPVPNFGFISFEAEDSVMKCLEARPIFLNGDSNSRINVEEKKARTSRIMDGNSMQRPGGRGGLRGGMSQGRGAGVRGGFSRENRGRGTFSQRR